MPPSSPDQPIPAPAPQIAPAERQRVVDLLTRHFASDQLTDGELEARLERVYAAATPAALHAVISDLPALDAPEPYAERITAVFSGQERKITGTAPRHLRVRARLGSVELDMRQATFEPGVTDIDVRAVMGYVQLRLPPGVRVESDGRALFGFFSLKGRPTPAAAGPASVVRITGRATFGFVECYASPGRKGRVGPGRRGSPPAP